MTDPALLHGFSLFMRSRLGLPYLPPTPAEPTVCLVRRSINRRILNEEDIVSALSKFVRVEVVQFDALSYREQVRARERERERARERESESARERERARNLEVIVHWIMHILIHFPQ